MKRHNVLLSSALGMMLTTSGVAQQNKSELEEIVMPSDDQIPQVEYSRNYDEVNEVYEMRTCVLYLNPAISQEKSKGKYTNRESSFPVVVMYTGPVEVAPGPHLKDFYTIMQERPEDFLCFVTMKAGENYVMGNDEKARRFHTFVPDSVQTSFFPESPYNLEGVSTRNDCFIETLPSSVILKSKVDNK